MTPLYKPQNPIIWVAEEYFFNNTSFIQ